MKKERKKTNVGRWENEEKHNINYLSLFEKEFMMREMSQALFGEKEKK